MSSTNPNFGPNFGSGFGLMLKRHRAWFALFALAGLALRLAFIHFWPSNTDDGRLYIQLALNLLHTGHYVRSFNGAIIPTTARLPGYPAFLALLFSIFGESNLRAVYLAQALLDLVTALGIAWLAWQLAPAAVPRENGPSTGRSRAARIAFALAALCPFFAMYTAAVLTETTAIFSTVAALGCALAGLRTQRAGWWAACGLALAAAIQLRPDSGLLLAILGLRLLWQIARQEPRLHGLRRSSPAWPPLRNLLLLSVISLTPVALWTLRNAVELHVFRPLVTTEATEVNEPTYTGFEHWSRTWLAGYRGVEDFLNNAPGDHLDPAVLPAWAFDSPAQKQRTLALLARYNLHYEFSARLDSDFDALARERIRSHPLRSFILLPLSRAASLWFSPRVEFLPIDDHWWPPATWWRNDPGDFTFTTAMLLVNLGLIGLGIWGLVRVHPLEWRLLLAFVVARTALLAYLGTCEPRYTLEAYPILLAWAAWGIGGIRDKGRGSRGKGRRP